LPNFLDAYGRDGKHKIDTLLGNHATKIFHRNGDPTTNEWGVQGDCQGNCLQAQPIEFRLLAIIERF
jgi:hypothetical protein